MSSFQCANMPLQLVEVGEFFHSLKFPPRSKTNKQFYFSSASKSKPIKYRTTTLHLNCTQVRFFLQICVRRNDVMAVSVLQLARQGSKLKRSFPEDANECSAACSICASDGLPLICQGLSLKLMASSSHFFPYPR